MSGASVLPPRRRAATAVLLAAAATVAAVAVLSAGPATADSIGEAQAELDQARAEAQAANRRYENTVAERSKAETDIATIEATIPALQARIEQLRANLAERAAALYRHTDQGTGFDDMDPEHINEPGRRVQLTVTSVEHDDQMAEDLNTTTDQLAQAQEQLQKRKAELDELVLQQARDKAAFDQKVLAAQRALERAIAIGAMRARGDTPVTGESVLTAQEIAGWYESTSGRQTRPGGLTPLELATIYVEEGHLAGVRGDIAFAQSIIETGSFSANGPNNFSGIGACDSCSSMNQFPTQRDGIRAQMQLLRNYGDANSRADQLLAPLAPGLYGSDPVRAAARFNSFFAKGWAPTWEQMGNGNWATDPGYAAKVLDVYDRMLDFADG